MVSHTEVAVTQRSPIILTEPISSGTVAEEAGAVWKRMLAACWLQSGTYTLRTFDTLAPGLLRWRGLFRCTNFGNETCTPHLQ